MSSILIKVTEGAGRPEGFINSAFVRNAWIEPCYKTDKETFDLSNEIARMIEKDIESDPYAITDDKKLYAIIEQGIEAKERDTYISVETKIALRLTLFDKYRKRTSTDYRLVIATSNSAKLEVAAFRSQADASVGLAILKKMMGPEIIDVLNGAQPEQ